ncbi:MAG TPA: hypothetical protein VEH04_02915 [Verrucomicrobiae bacterium]|nr:hypothetical protein [Verrucomicrobiae bacterium]
MPRWTSCNVLQFGLDSRRIWQFDGSSFKLRGDHVARAGEPLPQGLATKSWSSLYQPKLNIAWLPAEHVFIRVAQFPQATAEETQAMVELQMERLSPIPVTQAVWAMHPVGTVIGNMQTIILLIVSRNVVEEFLGRLEGEGYLADRLELPLLDQLQATEPKDDGAWIYPETRGLQKMAVVAWWYGGVLRNVDLITFRPGAQGAIGIKDQLMQMAWAGELDGWLTGAPKWHLVADDQTGAEWLEPLEQELGGPLERVAPLPAAELAARAARRAAASEAKTTLLPAEFGTRYRQQFVDRLWMRGLGAVLAIYVLGLIVYFSAVGFVRYQTTKAETLYTGQAQSYTNVMRLDAQYKVLKQRQELKYAALDCWQAVAETMPAGLTLDALNFSGGRRVSLSGTAPADQVGAVIDFSDSLRKFVVRGQQLFDQQKNEPPHTQVMPGGIVRWTYDLDLKRTGE